MQHDVASVDAKVMVDGKPAEGEFFWLMVVQLKLKRNCNSNFSNGS
jgi:hypothetical protein